MNHIIVAYIQTVLSELFDAPNFVVGSESMLNEFNKCLEKNCLPKQNVLDV